MTDVREATAAELEHWDDLTVRVPGGHVYQSRAWSAHRVGQGWRARHLMIDDAHAALVLERPWPFVGGSGAYIPRGPVVGPVEAAAAVERLAAVTSWLGAHGVDVVATDAEVPAADRAYGEGLRSQGFQPIPDIQPSRHRISLVLARDTDDSAVRSGLTKSTRQRVDAAERDAIVVVRHDRAGWTGMRPLFDSPATPVDDALATFADLLTAAGRRLGFRFGPRDAFLAWWRAAHAAGYLVYLEARSPAEPERTLGGLILYRHGERLTTVHSADAEGVRDSHPGVMHLLRWRAIQLAVREGCAEMDLGGVDVGPDHREPVAGEPLAGLYEHKRSFGASWVAMTGAHEQVMRPWRYSLGRVTGKVARSTGRSG